MTKEYSLEVLTEIENYDLDTTPERISKNRAKIAKIYSTADMGTKLGEYLYEYFHYFDTNYKSRYRIDDLPGLIKGECVKDIESVDIKTE